MTAHSIRLPEDRPLAIAHRAGNHPDTARRAYDRGADLIETDVWNYRGRLELRHIKTMGPVPLLWDRWHLEPGWRPRPVLADLLRALPVEARLFLDLKGNDLGLAGKVVDAVTSEQPGRGIYLCGRNWRQLDPVAGHPCVVTFLSVGSDDELAAVWPRLREAPAPAVSIHRRYLTPEIAGRLKALGTTIVTWPINSLADARHLHALGVDGFTTDNPWLIEQLARHRSAILDSSSVSAEKAPVSAGVLAPGDLPS